MRNKFILPLLLFSVTTFAQVPNWTKETCSLESGVAPVSYEMYNELASGNAVVVEFSAMWCSACNSSAQYVEEFWQEWKDHQVKVFSFLYQDQNSDPTDCDDANAWITTHGLTHPTFVDCYDVLEDYFYAFGDTVTGQIGLPWYLLFFPDFENHSSSPLMSQNMNEFNSILTGQWLPQVGLTSLDSANRKLIQILDMMGRETTFKPNTPLIYVYDDGSTEKVFSVEY